MLHITLPDGSVRPVESGTTGHALAASISEGLARNALAVRVNGEVRDLHRPFTEDATVEILTWNDTAGKATYWHSSAHLLAEALEAQNRLPEALAQYRLLVAENPGNPHWTFKAWKTADAALPDSLRRRARPLMRRPARPTGLEPLAPVNVLKPVPAQ